MSGAKSHLIKRSFTSALLRCEVTVTIFDQGDKSGLMFICLDETLTKLLTSRSFGLSQASFVSVDVSGLTPFHLSLASLDIYSAFLTYDLLPFLQTLLANESVQAVLVGKQFSGVLGLYTAARFPKQFFGVLGISASLWWKPEHTRSWEWFSRWLAEQSECPGKVCLLCSSQAAFDRPRGVPTTLMANRHLRDVLRAKSCQVTLLERPESKFSHAFLENFAEAAGWFIEKP